MAARTISTDQTLEDLRLQFNALSEQDFGDISTLDASLSSTSLVGAMNELTGIVATGVGFFIQDDSSTQQLLGPGQTLTFSGSSNIDAVVSATDTMTVSLKDNINITTITATGSSHTLGSIDISGDNISTNSGNDLQLGAKFTLGGVDGTYLENTDGVINLGSTSLDTDGYIYINTATGSLIFEGPTQDDFECHITCVDPTQDNDILFPNVSGTVITTGDTGTITTSMIGNDQVTEAKIGDDAVGQDQLKNVVNLQIINSSGSVLKSLFGAGA